MAAISDEPLEIQDLVGLQRPERLLEAVNRIQSEAGATLNGGASSGATLGNLRHLLLADKEVITPGDWTPLEFASGSGWTDTGPARTFGSFAVRKSPDGTVRIREVLARPAGAPAVGAVIATVPALYAPQATVRRYGSATGDVLSAWQVTAGGAVQWLFGDPTSEFFVTGTWQAADPSMPEWDKPIRLKVQERATVRRTYVEARAATGAEAGLAVPCQVYGARIDPPTSAEETPVLVIPRVDGLRPNTRYRLTILVLVE